MKQKRFLCMLVLPWMVLCAVGCNDDDNEVLNVPVDQQVQTGLNSALTTTVVPLVTFMGAMGDLLSSPGAVAGLACPDTSGWCSSGTVSCTPTLNGLAFDFDQCQVVGGDQPFTMDGNVTAVLGSTIALTLTNLVISGQPAISGTGTINVANCNYVVNMHSTDASVAGTVTQCDADPYPTGQTLAITFGDFVATVTFDGTSVAHATAAASGAPVAACTINLASSPLTSSCSGI